MTRFRNITAITTLLIAIVTAHHDDKNMVIPEELRERLFSGSTKAPMAQIFRTNQTALSALKAMHDHMQNVNDRLDDLMAKRRPYGMCSDDEVCNRKQRFAETAVRVKLTSLRLPPIAARCITEVDLQLSNSEQTKLWDDRMKFVDASKIAGLNAVKMLNRSNWNGKAYTHAKFGFSDHIDSCELLHNVGFKVFGRWAIMLSVSQFPMALQRRDRRREYQVEYLTYVNGSVGNLLVTLPRFSDRVLVNNTTTTWENWRGTPASSIFRTVAPLSENPAIAAALQQKAQWREQVEDSRTVSNISILTLSCLFTLVPLALFADVSLPELFVYTLATDIVSCVPLTIKAIELLLANRIHRKTVIWAYGDLKSNASLVVESWSSNCTAKDDVRYLGFGLLVMALSLMGLGVVFEFVARARLKRLKFQSDALRLREFNDRQVGMWSAETPCQQCSCYGQFHERSFGRFRYPY